MSIPDWQVEGTMEHAQREALDKALKEARFAVSHAAAKLRIGRSTVYRLMKRYDIAAPEKHEDSASERGTTRVFESFQQVSKVSEPPPSGNIIFDGENYLLKRG